jgi:hypothetical protein
VAKRSIAAKQIARLRKELSRDEPQAYVDVLAWMRARGHARTRKEAVELVLSGRLRGADGETIGILGEVGARYAAAFIKWEEAQGMFLIDETTNDAEKRAKVEAKVEELRKRQAEQDPDRVDEVRERGEGMRRPLIPSVKELEEEIKLTNEVFARQAEKDRAAGRRTFGT